MRDHKLVSFWGVRGILGLSSIGVSYVAINNLQLQDVISSFGSYAEPLTAALTSGATRIGLDFLASPLLYKINQDKYAEGHKAGEFSMRYFMFTALGRAFEIGGSTVVFKSLLDGGMAENLALVLNGKMMWLPTLAVESMAYDWLVLKENPLPKAGRTVKKAVHTLFEAPGYVARHAPQVGSAIRENARYAAYAAALFTPKI